MFDGGQCDVGSSGHHLGAGGGLERDGHTVLLRGDDEPLLVSSRGVDEGLDIALLQEPHQLVGLGLVEDDLGCCCSLGRGGDQRPGDNVPRIHRQYLLCSLTSNSADNIWKKI